MMRKVEWKLNWEAKKWMSRFRGWLVMVPVSRISDVPESQVPVSNNYSQVACWRDDNYVYVCVATEGSLKTLITQFSGAAA